MLLLTILVILAMCMLIEYFFSPIRKLTENILSKISIAQLKSKPIPPTETIEYIDLGLPSGTLWAKQKTDGFYNWYQAKVLFCHHLPSVIDFDELIRFGIWTWKEKAKGWNVIGPNGNEILLPTAGKMEQCFGKPTGKTVETDKIGRYWSSSNFKTNTTQKDSHRAYASQLLIKNPEWEYLQIIPNTKVSKLDFASVWLIKRKQS